MKIVHYLFIPNIHVYIFYKSPYTTSRAYRTCTPKLSHHQHFSHTILWLDVQPTDAFCKAFKFTSFFHYTLTISDLFPEILSFHHRRLTQYDALSIHFFSLQNFIFILNWLDPFLIIGTSFIHLTLLKLGFLIQKNYK